MRRPSISVLGQALLFLIPMLLIGYVVKRHETSALLSFFGFWFLVYAWILKSYKQTDFQFWIAAAFVLRIALLVVVPSLSDDFYRFVWDGRLLANGYHPFAELPGYYLSGQLTVPGIDQSLYGNLNSPEYFTIYPPVAQFVFWLAAQITPNSVIGSVIVMRIVLILAEVGTILLLIKLVRHFGLAEKRVLLYALNPLVIIELTGNLHFEALVIFFILLGIYFLVKSRVASAGVSFACAIGAKLLPLIFLPLFVIRIGLKKSFILYLSAGLTCILLFAPLFNLEIINKFGQSVELYFNKFEFNASIYYIVREYGYLTKGYNVIQTVGWKLAVLSTSLILLYSFVPLKLVRKDGKWILDRRFGSIYLTSRLPQAMMWVLFIYLLFTTTVHPWYITTLLMLSIFTNYRFVLVWTALIFLTYAGYSEFGFTEVLPLTILQYVVVIGYLAYELVWVKKETSLA